MNHQILSNSSPSIKGMTLMETVIAIGVIAVAVPLILAASTASLENRRSAEADTRSAWIAKDLKNQVSAVWATPRLQSSFPDSLTLDYPEIGNESDPKVFVYDNDGKFLNTAAASEYQTGSKQNKAQYLVTLYSKSFVPENFVSSTTHLSRLFIKVQYPAKAPLKKRLSNEFSMVTSQQQPF